MTDPADRIPVRVDARRTRSPFRSRRWSVTVTVVANGEVVYPGELKANRREAIDHVVDLLNGRYVVAETWIDGHGPDDIEALR